MINKEQLSIIPLAEALTNPPALFGRSEVTRLDNSIKALRRSQRKLDTVLKNIPGVFAKTEGIFHEDSGMVFVETHVADADYLLGCLMPNPEPLKSDRPLKIVTGICMFGAGAVVGHVGGKKYDLTNPQATRRVRGVIEDVVIDERPHLYEVETIARLSAFIGSLCKQWTRVNIMLHLPVPEYLIYGLDLYARGHMNTVALGNYMDAVRHKGRSLEHILKQRFKESGVELKTNSPLSWIQNIDFLALNPDEIPGILYQQVASRDDLWQKLANTASNHRQLLQLNYLSYMYQYFYAARHARTSGQQLAFVENPEELPIYLNSVKLQNDIDIRIDGAVMFYVHPRLLVVKKAYEDHGNFLYYCSEGFNERAINMAVRTYESGNMPIVR